MRDLELIRQSRGNDVAASCSEPPFPTHGGQDDGSYTNSLKLNMSAEAPDPKIERRLRGRISTMHADSISA